jgi:adenine-specific DNA-methyltransferase
MASTNPFSTSFSEALLELLSQDPRLAAGTSVDRLAAIQLARRFDADLLRRLLANDVFANYFFVSTDLGPVFKKDLFVDYLSNKSFLPDSYTAYANKIGLATDSRNLLSARDNVVLNWPYKDAILEGGQDKEDARRDEVFHNATLAADEVGRLLNPKAFGKWVKVDADGESESFTVSPADNLILRGNNLLVLHSLLPRYRGKIKLIYIDPPYNVGDDSFSYNDRFSHSTWLTFMRNRLEVAQQLLSKSGVLFMQIDYKEFAYLKVLADEVFGPEKALPHVTVKTSTPAGFKVINPGFINVTEQILVYVKHERNVIRDGFVPVGYQSDYNQVVLDKRLPAEEWQVLPITEAALIKDGYSTINDLESALGSKQVAKIVLKQMVEKFALDHADNVFTTYGPHKPSKTLSAAMKKSLELGSQIMEVQDEEGAARPKYLRKGRLLAFYAAKLQKIDGALVPTQRLTDIWTDISWDSLSTEGGVTLRNGKKPEALLRRIIDLTTEPGDLVLDYHLGSGTTAAVAHKMGRQYIGIEQIEYGVNDARVRLTKVVEGDQSGVSKAVGWAGGGSFVYAELLNHSAEFLARVRSSTSTKQLVQLFVEASRASFLSYRANPKTMNATTEEFEALGLDEQKQILSALVDHNSLYVNYGDMLDPDLAVSKADQAHNDQFYLEQTP